MSYRSTVVYITCVFHASGNLTLSGPALLGTTCVASVRPRTGTSASSRSGCLMSASSSCRSTLRLPAPPGCDQAVNLLRAARDLQTAERPGQCGHRPGEVHLFLASAAQPRFGAVTSPLGARAVDLRRRLRGIGEDDDLVVPHL